MTTTVVPDQPSGTAPGPSAEEFSERMLGAVLGAQFVQAAHLGDRLGYYRALASGPLTSTGLAGQTATAERYAREWLEHQAVCGVLTVDDAGAAPDRRRYTLPPGPAEVLTAEDSPDHVLPMAGMAAGLGKHLDALIAAYRSGGGVAWAELGDDVRQGQGGANRPLFRGALPREYLPSVPEVAAILRDGGRVADVGCGVGWSAIGLAEAHPRVAVDGFDVDAPSIELARRNAEAAGVAGRVRFHHGDAAEAAGSYDLVSAYECIHDLPDPVGVLRSMRRLAGPGGFVLVMDERVAETFTAPGDEVEQLMYGWSITCCLPDGLSTEGSAGTGTVMRPEVLRRYATEAGFDAVDVLPIEDLFFRFYRLR
jgi:2-polyprenyl-3-methyl-5-hydroxy-6-metoxy-1,4-benzoquinol methylase